MRDEKGLDTLDRPVNWALGRVPAEDFLDALVDVEALSIRPDREVGGDERVHHGSHFERKVGELVCETALGCFDPGTGVMGHQADKPRRVVVVLQVSRAVQGVQAGIHKAGCLADVVQPRGYHQQITITRFDRDRQLRGPPADTLDMGPAPAHLRGVEQASGKVSSDGHEV
ncbi:hypothetical protein [Micromonospora aurantiaca (nom. illeg.)]|uniref:hypothetical protein n=1 Tax=Micromonospora aurantiaca (nom. illeg.) TaxID=47850 RepID=UPI0035B1FF9D